MSFVSCAFHNDHESTYQMHSINGFTVLVSHRLIEDSSLAMSAVGLMAIQLGNISRVVLPQPLGVLRSIRIWMELAEKDNVAETHWNPNTLMMQRRNAAKSGCVEMTNCRHFVDWAASQPWMVMHELAHAYQCKMLTDQHAGIKNAFAKAKASGKYELVGHITGGQRRAYAMDNHLEYFSELTEAFFGKNDHQPFTYEELEQFDPVGFQLMIDIWGLPIGKVQI